ncbi:MAG: hypothetical protein ACXADA_24655 [Candidatus Hodarchaeales archaeon]
MAFKTVIYHVNGKAFRIDRPLQVREIPLKATSERGFLPSLKQRSYVVDDSGKPLEQLILDYESPLEHDFFCLLDHDPNCLDLQPQPIELYYEATNKKDYSFYPDAWALFIENGNLVHYLFEIKPESNLTKLAKDKNWQRKLTVIQARSVSLLPSIMLPLN